MDEPTRTIVTLGSNRGLKKLAFFLSREAIETHEADTPETAASLCQETNADAVLLCWPRAEAALDELGGALESDGGPVIVVLAEPDSVPDATELVQRGRVVLSTDEPALRLEGMLAGVLAAGVRRAVRVLVKLSVELDDSERDGRLRGTLHRACQTVNLSESGMALRTRERLVLGSRISFSFFLPDDDKRIEGEAEVVRRIAPEAEGYEGLGLQFLSFRSDSRKRLREFLGLALEESQAVA